MGYTKNRFSLVSAATGFHLAAMFLLISSLLPKIVLSQTTQTTAERLRQNTVRIEAKEHGFGFVVGEEGSRLYIVTARHVLVDEDDPDASPSDVHISFYSDQGTSYSATVLETHEGDLAVLRLSSPPGFHWVKAALGTSSETRRGTQVWFVGRRREWYVPAQPGSISSEQTSSKSQIEIDGLTVAKGTSGAPLIASTGIVGMIQSDSADDTRALTIDAIQRAFQRWNYPWGLEPGQAVAVATPSPTPVLTTKQKCMAGSASACSELSQQLRPTCGFDAACIGRATCWSDKSRAITLVKTVCAPGQNQQACDFQTNNMQKQLQMDCDDF